MNYKTLSIYQIKDIMGNMAAICIASTINSNSSYCIIYSLECGVNVPMHGCLSVLTWLAVKKGPFTYGSSADAGAQQGSAAPNGFTWKHKLHNTSGWVTRADSSRSVFFFQFAWSRNWNKFHVMIEAHIAIYVCTFTSSTWIGKQHSLKMAWLKRYVLNDDVLFHLFF